MRKKTTEGNQVFKRSRCPITNALDIFGDKWSLLVIRDLVIGKRRTQEFLSSPEKIATNILVDRLKKLEAMGLITRHPYQQNPVRYECILTDKGKSLQPVMDTIIAWSKKNIPGTKESSRYLVAIRSQTRRKQNMKRYTK